MAVRLLRPMYPGVFLCPCTGPGPPVPLSAGGPDHQREVMSVSWSVTCDDLDKMDEIPDAVLAKIADDGSNLAYAKDAALAFTLAKQAGLVSGVLAGGRTPSPYGGPDVVDIAVHGLDSRREGQAVPKLSYYGEMRDVVTATDQEYEDAMEQWNTTRWGDSDQR